LTLSCGRRSAFCKIRLYAIPQEAFSYETRPTEVDGQAPEVNAAVRHNAAACLSRCLVFGRRLQIGGLGPRGHVGEVNYLLVAHASDGAKALLVFCGQACHGMGVCVDVHYCICPGCLDPNTLLLPLGRLFLLYLVLWRSLRRDLSSSRSVQARQRDSR
jgi:hypothetical protein